MDLNFKDDVSAVLLGSNGKYQDQFIAGAAAEFTMT